MTHPLDKREEGLRALARIIATAYRRRMTGETAPVSPELDSDDELFLTTRKRRNSVPEDRRQAGEYSEIVSVENFLRNKNHYHNQQKIKVKDSKGGEHVANKGSIRDCEAAPAGQDQAGHQKGE